MTSSDLPPDSQTLRLLHRVFRRINATGDWQISSKMILRRLQEHVHPTGVPDIRTAYYVRGMALLVDLGDRLGADVYYGHYSEVADLILLRALCPPDGTAVDVGANCGHFSVLLATDETFTGRLIAVEPTREAAALLEQNLRSAPRAKVLIRHECLGSSDGETEFHVAQESAFSGISDTGRSSIRRVERIRQLRLDTMLHELELDSISVMKVDVEGHEADVISGAAQTLAGSPNLVALIEVSKKNLNTERRNAMSRALVELRALDFRPWQIRKDVNALVSLEGEPFDNLEGNIFFVRANSAAETRLLSEFALLKDSVEGKSYLSGYISPDDAPSEDLVHMAERLSLRALAEQQAERAWWQEAHAKLKKEYERLEEQLAKLEAECGLLKKELEPLRELFRKQSDERRTHE